MARTFLPRISSVAAQKSSVAIWRIRRRRSSTDSTSLRRRATARPRFARCREQPPRSRVRCAPLPRSGRAQTARGSAAQSLWRVARWPRSCASRWVVHGSPGAKATDLTGLGRQSAAWLGGRGLGTSLVPGRRYVPRTRRVISFRASRIVHGSERLPDVEDSPVHPVGSVPNRGLGSEFSDPATSLDSGSSLPWRARATGRSRAPAEP
jgi:hypothetical protein